MADIIFSKSSGLNDSIYGKAYAPIKMMIEKRAEAFEQESILPKIYNMEKSENFGEMIPSMSSMNGLNPVVEGGAYPTDGYQEADNKFLEHVTWKSRFTITREMVEDSKILNLKQQPTAFTAAAYRTKEMYGSALLTGGTAAKINFRGTDFDTTTADGLSLFNTAHKSAKVAGSKAQSNLFSDAFSDEILAYAETAMQNFKDDNGNPLGVAPDTIIIPNDAVLKKTVFAAIGADKDPNTANNGFNFQYGRWTVIVNPYWVPAKGTATPYIIMSSTYNTENVGAVWYDRVPLSIIADEDKNNDNMIWRGRARFVAGFNDWRAFAMGGASGGTSLKA